MSHGRTNKKVIFLLAGWRTRLWMYWLTAKIFERNGYYCITYAYDNGVLSPDTLKTVENLRSISQDILSRIETLKKEDYQNFSIFGTSLGSLIALMVANKNPEISKIILSATGSDLAEAVWNWDTVKPYFKKSLLEQNFTLYKLQKAWKTIAPKNNIDNLKGRKILIYLSRRDRIVPYYLGEELVNEIKKMQCDYRLITYNFLSHAMMGGYNLLNESAYLNFLKQK